MSKPATTSTPKIAPPPLTKSAWAKGPPSSTAAPLTRTASSTNPSRSASPAPNAATTPTGSVSHSRRPSTLGQGVAIKDGVSVPQRNASAVKPGSSVTFGSIDDVSAPISSSPAAVPTLKSQGVKAFGSVPAASAGAPAATNGRAASPAIKTPADVAPPTPATAAATVAAGAAKSPSPAPASKINRADIAKLFQGGGAGNSAPSTTPPSSSSTAPPAAEGNATRSPAPSNAPLPGTPAAAPSPLGAHSYTPFVPSAQFRGGPPPPSQGAPGGQHPPGSPLVAPRSPVYPRQMSNGGPPRGPGPPGTPTNVAHPLPSPRMGAAHIAHHPGQSPGMPPQGMPGMPQWAPGYYYPYSGMPPPPEGYPYQPGWPVPPPMAHPQYGHHPGTPGPPGPPHLATMSPRTGPAPLAPGTPTQAHAQVPPTPGGPNAGPGTPHGQHAQLAGPHAPGGPGALPRLNSNASAFVPGGGVRKSVIIKDASGREVDLLRNAKVNGAPPTPSTPVAAESPMLRDTKRSSIRIESPADKLAREKKEQEEKQRVEREAKEKKDREEAEQKAKEEEERKIKEEEERKKKEEEERVKHEEEERVKKEEEEREKARLAKEEEERKIREEEERKVREEEERKKAEAEAEERARKEAEEKERLEQERLKKEEEERATAAAAAEAEAKAKAEAAAAAAAEKEDGEIADDDKARPPALPLDKDPSKPGLKIDTALTTPESARRRPGPLDLSVARGSHITAPLPSALATARIIEDIDSIKYPEGIMSPKLELNVGAKGGKFRYDRDFLLQFMSVCKEKPDMLPPLDAIGLEPADQSFHSMSRGGSGRRASGAMAPPSLSRQASVGLGINPGGSFGKAGGSGFNMGQFGTGKSSEERFALANSQRGATPGGPAGFRPTPMVRGGSQQDSNRRRSKRGEKRPPQEKGPGGFAPPSAQTIYGPDGHPLPPVKPLEKAENAWNPMYKQRNAQVDENDPAIVDRKVKALLNKLTMEKFDSISDQIINWANKSVDQTDGRTLIQVIRLVFEKATDEAAWSEMYARLCRKMMEQISPQVQDEGIKNADGKPIAGGQLFRKYLLNRCQEDFERGWAQKDAAAAAAAAKSSEDQATAKANEGKEEGDDEIALYSEEYYISQKAKRQGLGLVKFIGELFKLQMLTERIMHECVKKLLGNVENPEEEEIESLCKLLSTVGRMLDTARAGPHMDIYFSRMRELKKNPKVNSRMQFMLTDVLELRERKWVPRNLSAAPATISQIREDAAKEAQKEANQRTMNMSRGGSRRGGDRGDGNQVGPDGWAVAGSNAPRPPPKAGDLSKFGQISKPTAGPTSLGPNSVFSKKENKRESVTRSSSNMFQMLSQNPELASEVAATPGKISRAPSRKASVDLSAGGAPELPLQRRKLQLLPRSKPVEGTGTPAGSEPNSEDEGEDTAAGEAPAMSEGDAKKKIDEDLKEFFAIRNIDEGEEYFHLPAEHRHLLVDKLVSRAVESKEADAQLVSDLFARAKDKNLCAPEQFEQGFLGIAEFIDDIAIDAPKAWNFFALMIKGSGLSTDTERRDRIADKTGDAEKLVGLLA